MHRSFRLMIAMLALLSSIAHHTHAEDPITVTTWNIELLGGSDRGQSSGFGRGSLPQRTPEQLKAIASLIRDELKSDILAIQEVALTKISRGLPHSEQLQAITEALGPGWKYTLPSVESVPAGHANMFNAFIWNTKRVRLIRSFAMDLPDFPVDRSALFARRPLVGYFENLHKDQGTIDYVLVNVHLKSGQSNTANHLVAMTLLEDRLTDELTRHQVHETDRIILGDFNDNPHAKNADGSRRYSDVMYQYMASKGFRNLVAPELGYTRMDQSLNSLIDHILVNSSSERDMPDNQTARRYTPGPSTAFAAWRQTYSDHFPLSFTILNTKTRDDDGDFNHPPFGN